MFKNLIPWGKKSRELKVHHDIHPISKFRSEFDSLMDRYLQDWSRGLNTWAGSQMLGSRFNLDDETNEYVVRAELPGFEPDDIEVKVSGNVITLRAEHKEETKEGNGHFQRYGSFYESFTLPQGVISDQIDARYHSGILEVHLPKSAECQAKRIEVKSA